MTLKERIEKLKKPELAQALGVYDEYYPELAKIIRKAGSKNCLYFSGVAVDWVQSSGQVPDISYILRPDYKPEPEYEDIDIVVGKNGEVSLERPYRHEQARFTWWATVNKESRGFFYDTNGVPCRISIDRVAEHVAKGLKVYARFVKEG